MSLTEKQITLLTEYFNKNYPGMFKIEDLFKVNEDNKIPNKPGYRIICLAKPGYFYDLLGIGKIDGENMFPKLNYVTPIGAYETSLDCYFVRIKKWLEENIN